MTAPPQAARRPGDVSLVRRHNLPTPHTHLIGREQDGATISDLVLRAPGRMVTLTGTGGCGKTQLALLVAGGLVDSFADGVWLVELASVQAPHLVPYAVASVLGRRERVGETLTDTLVADLKARELLLVLDNCEHLIDACADMAERLVVGCPRLRLLTTSRERLRIGAETTWRVPSLPGPDPRMTLTPADLLAYPAVRLFVERAQAVQPDFALTPDVASTMAGICARLEGLPLALELAALAQGDLAAARALSIESLKMQAHQTARTGTLLLILGQVAIHEGEYAAAGGYLSQAFALLANTDDLVATAQVVEALAHLASRTGRPDVALRLAGAAEAARERLDVVDSRSFMMPSHYLFSDLRDRWLIPLKKTVDAENADRRWAEGRALSLNEAIALAETGLAQTPSGSLPPLTPDVAGLTSREAEVLRLLAQGQSNKQIAAQLVLSVRTVERHITNLYGKIDARGKADATACAFKHGLL